ncbi:MAG: hypothetical protein ACP5LP_01195 [Candidatus Micrarchaeia archaeon]
MENEEFDKLWNIYQKEKKTNELLELNPLFYSKYSDIINEPVQNLQDSKLANTKKLIIELFEIRKQKILVYLAYKKTLPNLIPNEEKNFYSSMLIMTKASIVDLVNGKSTGTNENVSSVDSATKDTKKYISILKIIIEIPEIQLPSGNKLGPLSKNDTVIVESEEDVSYLLNNKICEKIS